ncbi:IME4 [Malassezia furfur]|nr:IME4 [Malassezia furfur]
MHSGGSAVDALCEHITRDACAAHGGPCARVHFRPVYAAHTNPALGHCGYLHACHRKATCKFVHFVLDRAPDEPAQAAPARTHAGSALDAWLRTPRGAAGAPLPAQWISCDLRTFDLAQLGTFDVIVADPPWDIHMSLPYGTLSDEQMYALPIPQLQDEGLLFLWVTGRAMELGRALLQHWGYVRIDELVWVKINQLQRLIRTGRTGHWLNHTKEHCFVGLKRRGMAPVDAPPPGMYLPLPTWLHRDVGNDVIVAPVRDTSRKPDELYTMIERLCPGARKVELFGRQHNVRPGWLTLGNQLRGNHVVEPRLVAAAQAAQAAQNDAQASAAQNAAQAPAAQAPAAQAHTA